MCRWLLLLLAMLMLSAAPAAGQVVRPLDLSQQSFLRSDRMGFTFVAYTANIGKDANTRYRQALEMGAGWTRYPLYWNAVETVRGAYNWGIYDNVIAADRAAGLQTNAILMGSPPFYGSMGNISGMYEPVFADGTDTPAPGKAINPAHPWAQYVYAAVNRYRPGGALAQARGWGNNGGVRVWEAWNEPDFDWFWRASTQDYARLLKVTYLAVKHADPNAQVMFGGLAYSNPDTNDMLGDVLSIYANDPDAPRYNWYMDIVGLHSYTNSRRTGLVISRVKGTLAEYGLTRPVWLNETGVAVWDDYPGPVWAADDPGARRLRATQEQQAAYVVQSTAYALAAGAEKVFFHQLYDDCGNEPGDHAPGDRAAGDAYGFYRNTRANECFTQHPQPGTPRPAVDAYRVTANVLGRGALTNGRVIRRGDGSVFVRFERPNRERITVMWNERTTNNTIQWAAESNSAQVISYTGGTSTLTPVSGSYEVTLPPARPDDDPQRAPGNAVSIGGAAFIVVERLQRAPNIVQNPVIPVTPRAPLPSEIGSVLDAGGARSSISLGDDITPPITGMDNLPATSPEMFTVRWNGSDAGGIEKYLVWVRVNDGEWQPWLETTRTQGEYIGARGNTYAFAVWAVDSAGNWSLNTDLQPQTWTRVE